MTALHNLDLERLNAFLTGLPPCPNGCSRQQVYPTPTFNTRDSIEDQVTVHIRKTAQNQAWLLRMHVFDTHRYEFLKDAAEHNIGVRREVDQLFGRLVAAETMLARVRAFADADQDGLCCSHVQGDLRRLLEDQ